jgi:hypothetical protein
MAIDDAFTVVIPRVGSFALASFGRTRKVHGLPFRGSAGRKSLALKRRFEVASLLIRYSP